jgi:hypothetical protein
MGLDQSMDLDIRMSQRSGVVAPAWLAGIGLVVALVCPGPARAAVFDYTATLELDLGSIPSFEIQAEGEISVDPDGSFSLPAGLFATTRTLIPPQTPSEAVANVELQLSNATGSFSGPGSPGGSMGLNGQAVLNLQTFFGFPPLALGLTPMGAGGSAMTSGSNGSTSVTATLTGALWQTGVFQQFGITASSSVFSQRTNTGEDLRTSGGAGVVTYVVPAYLTTRLDGSFSERSPATALLTITFVPEPGPLLGQSAVAALLVLWGARKRRLARPRT